jgi:hypothetical protein
LVRLEELNIEYVPNADRKFLGILEKEGLQQQLSSKGCKVLDGKDQKKLKSIDAKGIRKAMKEYRQGPQIGCKFIVSIFLSKR